ncbi:hypothetical protein [Streptomyces phaeochromogenes]|jgi:hypothetical protein|uniref:hypothetical protein n=1 Tax=Streptomyces phaeochromogenes TaxID=1923 RepID=UPI0036B7907E
MDPLVVAVLASVGTVLIVAVAAVLVVRFVITGTDSQHRARVLTSAAEVIRAIRGKR